MKVNVSEAVVRQYFIIIIGIQYFVLFFFLYFLHNICSSVNLGVLTSGLSLGWPSPVTVKLRNGTNTPLSRPITEEECSWIISGGYLAAIFSNLLGGMLMDAIGRKYCIILVSIPKLFAAIWTIFASEVWMLILCRVVMGVCDNFMFVVVPVYASEIACKNHRGSLGTILHIFSCLGTVITLSIGPFLSYAALNIFIAAFIAVATLPVIYLPDSPVYLYSKGRIDDAIKILSLLRDSDVITKKEIEDYKLSSNKHNVGKKNLLKNKLFVKSLLLGLLLCAGTNLIGCNAISLYLQTILKSTKTNLKPEIASVIIACIQLFAASCTSFIMNKFGRRTILIFSVSGIACGMMGLGTYFKIIATDGYIVTGFMNYLPLISLLLVIYCYSTGIGNLIFIVTAEIFDGPTRAIGFSVCILVSVLLTFISTKYFAQMNSVLGPATTYYFFSGMSIILCVLITVFIPETKAKSFDEIQIELDKRLIHIPCLRKEQNYYDVRISNIQPIL